MATVMVIEGSTIKVALIAEGMTMRVGVNV